MSIPHLKRKILVNAVLQFLTKVLLRVLYRIRIEGTIDAPPGRGVLFISNHISFIDFMMMALIVPSRRAIFSVMDYEIYRLPVVHAICRYAATIPIASKKISLEVRERAFAQIHELLAMGHYVLFFPEGVVSYDGKMTPFQHGLERIKHENPEAMIIPVTIEGLQGGFFSRVGGLFRRDKLLKEFRREIRLKIGPSIPACRWNIEHFETKVRLMLKSLGNQQIDCTSPLQLPAVRESKRIPFSPNTGLAVGEVLTGEASTPTPLRLLFLNYSPGGLCVEVNQPLASETLVKITLKDLGIDCSCSVRWCQQVRSGRYQVGLKIEGNHAHESFIDLTGMAS
jgi:1-acyl-sn-glycerol-3-phosphate acyltransferase